MASVTGTLSTAGTASGVFFLRAGETANVILTVTGTATVQLQGAAGQPAQAYRDLQAFTATTSGTLWKNTTGASIYLRLYAVSLGGGSSVAYTVEDVAGDQVLEEWRAADGTLAFRITDQGPMSATGPSLDVRAFGAVGDGVTDNADAFDAAKAAASAARSATGRTPAILFPAGTYAVSRATNWFVNGLRLVSSGEVVILSTAASGNIVTVDAGAATNGYDFGMTGQFVLEGDGSGVEIGLYTRNVNHSEFEVEVRNVVTTGCKVEGAVLNKYAIACTINRAAMTTTPVHGLTVDGSGIITDATACEFDCVIEGTTGDGIDLIRSAYNRFTGTSEGNSGLGVRISEDCIGNVFDQFFMEANDTGDVDCYGKANDFRSCVASSRAAGSPFESVKSVIFRAGSERNTITGTTIYAAEVEATAVANAFLNVNALYDIDDSGTRTRIENCRRLFLTSTIVPGFKPGNLANSDASVLDWYEEGTFTPSFGGSSANGTLTHDIQAGTFTRIGNRVMFSLMVRVSVVTVAPTGDLLVLGLPYTSAASPSQQAVSVGNWSSLTLPASRVDLAAYIPSSTTNIRLVGAADGLASSLVQGTGLAASLVSLSGQYAV